MKLISLLLSFAISISLPAQIKNFRSYQEGINSAELSLVEGNKKDAFNKYYSVLTKSEGNFSKDIYNALLLAKELSKPGEFFILLNLLQKKGFSNSYLNELKEFEHFHTNAKWIKFLKANENYQVINKDLKSKMDSLFIKDQFFRTKQGSYKVYGDTIKQIDSLNMAFLFSLVKTNKFPGEDEIGVKDIRGTQPYDVIFHHYTQGTSLDKKKSRITPLLINLVLQGKILPNKAALWLEMQNGEFKSGVFDIMGFRVEGKQVRYLRPVYGDVHKMVIDAYRQFLYLESLEDYYKKFAFVIKNPDSKYKFDVSLNIFPLDEKSFLNSLQTMIEIK